MDKLHTSATYTNATIAIAAVAAVVALALIAVSPAHAACVPEGTPGGGSGDDRLCGTSGADVLLGQDGNDDLFGGGGTDTLDGGFGIDHVEGNAGNDIVIGGPGGNLLGFGDVLRGDAGNDALRFRDGEVDNFNSSSCGSGTDSLDIDLADATFLAVEVGGVFGLLAIADLNCESVTVGAINEPPNVIISRRSLRVGSDGRAKVSLTCPATLLAPCAGTLRIGRSEKSEGAPKAYSIDQGTKGKVSARLSRRDRRKLSRRGEITAHVTSVEQGEFGDKTTLQTLTAHGKRHT
jgi:hypothetical protein